MFIASSAAATTMCVGPEEHGGFGDLASKIDAEAARTGRPAIEVGEEVGLNPINPFWICIINWTLVF